MKKGVGKSFLRTGDSIAFAGPRGSVSSEELLRKAHDLSRRLPVTGHAINLCEDRVNFAIGFLAAIWKQHPILLPHNKKPATVMSLADRYPDTYCLVDEGCSVEYSPRTVQVDWSRPTIRGKLAVPSPDDDQLCVLVFTSGSTGVPKANKKFWRTLVHGTSINQRYLWAGLDGGPKILATVPPQHMYGLETTILTPLFSEAVGSSRHLFFPADILSQLEQMSRPRVLVSSPLHLRALVSSATSLPAVDLVLSATAPMDDALAAKVEDGFGGPLREVYGCTEAGCFAHREPTREKFWSLFEGFELQLNSGRAILRADHLPDPVVLHDFIDIKDTGLFSFQGRLSDHINIAGKRASLADLNIQLLSLSGIEDGVIIKHTSGCAPDRDRLVALVVTRMTVGEVQNQLRKMLDPVFVPRQILIAEYIPRTPTGKIERREIDTLIHTIAGNKQRATQRS